MTMQQLNDAWDLSVTPIPSSSPPPPPPLLLSQVATSRGLRRFDVILLLPMTELARFNGAFWPQKDNVRVGKVDDLPFDSVFVKVGTLEGVKVGTLGVTRKAGRGCQGRALGVVKLGPFGIVKEGPLGIVKVGQ